MSVFGARTGASSTGEGLAVSLDFAVALGPDLVDFLGSGLEIEPSLSEDDASEDEETVGD